MGYNLSERYESAYADGGSIVIFVMGLGFRKRCMKTAITHASTNVTPLLLQSILLHVKLTDEKLTSVCLGRDCDPRSPSTLLPLTFAF
jgi:RNase H-fold protein (predicted Holliday junction resolvase)